jgi:hypothetical protein
MAGAYNSFAGTRIENPYQTSGYPASSTGIRFDSGLYAINNMFADTYCELSGSNNKGIHIYHSGATGYCTPNYFIGGHFSVNGAAETPTFDTELASSVYGFHFDAFNLLPTRRLAQTPDGTLIQETYPNGGGILQTDTSGTTVYTAT